MLDEAFLEELAALLEVEPSALTPEFELTSDNWDSLAVVGTIVLIDEHYGITVDAKALADCQSIEVLGALIAKHREE